MTTEIPEALAVLTEALLDVLRAVPASDGNGGFFVEHCSIDGEYLGCEQIDPCWVVQNMAEIAQNALAAVETLK